MKHAVGATGRFLLGFEHRAGERGSATEHRTGGIDRGRQQPPQRREGQLRLQLLAGRRQRPEVGPRTAFAQNSQQCRLPDPRLALDHQEPAGRRREQPGHRLELEIALQQRQLGHPGNSIELDSVLP